MEYWAHVAAFMPVELWPHMRHRMRAYEARGHEWAALRQQPELVDSLLAEIARPGRRRRRATSTTACPATKEHWGWNWSDTKKALEYLFARPASSPSPAATAPSSGSTTCPSG